MKTKIIVLFAVLLVFLAGCAQEKQLVCSDGSIVDDISKCPLVSKEAKEAEEQPEIICNNNGKCGSDEDCSCSDCTGLLRCKELEQNEYLLAKGEVKKVNGKSLTLLSLEPSGRSTLSVDGVTKEIPGTKVMEIINNLEVTVQEVSYDPVKERTEAIFKIKEYEPELDEYLFEKVGAEKIIESVRIRLNKVEKSTPQNFVLLDVGVALNEKVKEGETKEIEGLAVTLVKSWPKGTPSESYAILKVKKV